MLTNMSNQGNNQPFRFRSAMAHLTDDYEFICASDEFAKWLGISEKELAGKKLAQQVGKHVFTRMKPQIEACLSGKQTFFRHLVPTAHGHRWTEFMLRPCHGNNEGIYLVAKDVHEES